jgi:cytochrome P450
MQIVSNIASAVMGLIERPEVFARARAEIDRVVGTDRLPNFDDYDQLPYITAMSKEALRWREVGPIGKLP